MDGRLSITKAQTPTGTTFQFINMYQFTAANPRGQTEMWTATENWLNKQKDSRIILQGLPKSHKKFDHCQIWTQLPHLDFPKQASIARMMCKMFINNRKS